MWFLIIIWASSDLGEIDGTASASVQSHSDDSTHYHQSWAIFWTNYLYYKIKSWWSSTLVSMIINIDYYQENEWWQRCASSTIRHPPVLPPTQLPLERGEHNDGGDDWWRWWWWLWCHFPQTGLKIRKPDTEESSTAMASVIVIFLLLIVLLFIVLIIMYGDSKIT